MTLHLRSLFVIILFTLGGSLYAQIGIGTQTPNDNAALEITSPDKGLLISRIDLGSSATTFLNGTGANENGMFVYHTGTGLDGEGLYVWQYNSDTSSGTWLKFATGDIGEVSEGSTTNATLRWDGSEWALKVYRVYRVFKEKREIQATRDRRVFKGYKEYKATKVTLEPLLLSEMELSLQQKITMVHLRLPMMMERRLLHQISLLRKRFQMI